MKLRWITALTAGCLAACSSYTPLRDPELQKPLVHFRKGQGVRATFLGNSNILVTDGTTTLLVDGFFSRPGALRTLFWTIGPDGKVIGEELKNAGLDSQGSVNALLVGHAHHDHAMDTVEVARRTGALVVGNESYGRIHGENGGNCDEKHLRIVPRDGMKIPVGDFVVTFVPSGHVSSHAFPQRMVEGHIERPFKMPAHFSRFNCGDVHAIHIAHREGNVFVTTTAGAREGKTRGLDARVVFLGVGLLGKECPKAQDNYWKENVTALGPEMVVPVHWDSFTRKLSKGLQPPLLLVDNTEKSIGVVKRKAAGKRDVHVMDLRESVYLRRGKPIAYDRP